MLKELKVELSSAKENKTAAQSSGGAMATARPRSAAASSAVRFCGHRRALESRICILVELPTDNIVALFETAGSYAQLIEFEVVPTANGPLSVYEDQILLKIREWRNSWNVGQTWTAYISWTPPTARSTLQGVTSRVCSCIPSLLRMNDQHGDPKTCYTRRVGQEVLLATLHHVARYGPLLPQSLDLKWDTNRPSIHLSQTF